MRQADVKRAGKQGRTNRVDHSVQIIAREVQAGCSKSKIRIGDRQTDIFPLLLLMAGVFPGMNVAFCDLLMLTR